MHQEFDPRDLEPTVPPETVRKRRLIPAMIALVALGGFGGVLWYAYKQSQMQRDANSTTPVIHADAAPTKVKPDQPGGMDVPNQDSLVLNNNAGAVGQPPSVERLLPPPETPLPRPSALPPAPTGTAPLAAAPTITPPSALPPVASAKAPAGGATPPAATPPGQAPAPAAAPRTTVQAQALPGTPPKQVAAAPATTPPVGSPSVASPPAPAATPQPAAPVASQVATATVPKAAPAATSGAYKIQLAAVQSAEAADQEWGKMQRLHPELASLKMSTQRIELGQDKKVYFRIQAGPFPDFGAADHLCDDLKQKHQACLVVRP
jgi:hypothetical protein